MLEFDAIIKAQVDEESILEVDPMAKYQAAIDSGSSVVWPDWIGPTFVVNNTIIEGLSVNDPNAPDPDETLDDTEAM